MKYIVAFTITLLITSSTTQAQDTTAVAPAAKTQYLLNKLTEELSLTEEQQVALLPVLEARQASMAQARTYDKGTPERRNQVQGANQAAIGELRKILTEAQFELLKELRASERAQKRQFYQETGETEPEADEETDF